MNGDRLRGQVDYYRTRAEEYDDFWLRRGNYALPRAQRDQWFTDAAEAEDAVRTWVPVGTVLEIACGTGLWTQHLVRRATSVMVVDAAPEMLDLHRQRLAPVEGATSGIAVKRVLADVFSWRPASSSFDAVFFGYWHSHVPDDRLEGFWADVRRTLRPGGRVMLVDSSAYPPGTPGDQNDGLERRRISDGREFHVVKRYWDPDDLTAFLSELGWSVSARTTTHGMILLAQAEPATDGRG